MASILNTPSMAQLKQVISTSQDSSFVKKSGGTLTKPDFALGYTTKREEVAYKKLSDTPTVKSRGGVEFGKKSGVTMETVVALSMRFNTGAAEFGKSLLKEKLMDLRANGTSELAQRLADLSESEIDEMVMTFANDKPELFLGVGGSAAEMLSKVAVKTRHGEGIVPLKSLETDENRGVVKGVQRVTIGDLKDVVAVIDRTMNASIESQLPGFATKWLDKHDEANLRLSPGKADELLSNLDRLCGIERDPIASLLLSDRQAEDLLSALDRIGR
jgi:hypothetical protein